MALGVAGLLNQQTAVELGTSQATVQEQPGHVMQKSQAGSVAELVRFDVRLDMSPDREWSVSANVG